MRPFAKPCGAPAEFRYEQVGVPKKLFGFTAILSYSRMRYVTFVKRCDAPTLIRCLMEAFEYFEGLPKAALTDRMKTVLLSMDGNLPIWHPRFADAHGLYRGLPTGVQALHASDQRFDCILHSFNTMSVFLFWQICEHFSEVHARQVAEILLSPDH